MSNMGAFKNTTDIIIKWLEGHGNINEVTFGDANEVDLSTKTNFPLAHVIPITGVGEPGYTTYNYNVYFLDTFENSNEEKISVLDAQAITASEFLKAFGYGSMFQAGLRLQGTIPLQIAYNVRVNNLYGWSATINVMVPNNLNCA